jgi:phosphate uptake regulator
VPDDSYEIKILHREITEIAQDLLLAELSWKSSLRFIFSSELICNALQAMHSHAVEIAAKVFSHHRTNRSEWHSSEVK